MNNDNYEHQHSKLHSLHSMAATSLNNPLKKTLKRSLSKEQQTINRLQLFATVKILLQYLSKEKPHLRYVAQKVLKDCHKQHQQLNKNNCNNNITLAELIEKRLRETVGEKCWRIAKTIQQRQCSISLKSINRHKNQTEFIVTRSGPGDRETNTAAANQITLIVPLTNNNKYSDNENASN